MFIRLFKKKFDGIRSQVGHSGFACLFNGNGHHFLEMIQSRGFLTLQVVKKRMDGCQPLISGRNTAASFGFKPLEKSGDQITGQKTHGNPLHGYGLDVPTVFEQQFKGIPIGINRIFADIFLGWKVYGKKFCQVIGEISGFHLNRPPVRE
jgi:hypothetical protein